MKRGLPLLILASLLATAAHGQWPSERLETLSRLRAKPPSAWTDDDATEVVRTIFVTVVEVAVDHLSPGDRARLGEPRVEVGRWEDRAPASMVDGTLLLQERYFEEIIVLAALLAHDLHVVHLDWLPDPQPLLTRPWAETPLLPALRPLHRYAELSAWISSCPQQFESCTLLLAATVAASLGFVASHEFAHLLLGHEGDGSAAYPLAQEKSADLLARQVLAEMHAEAGFEDGGFATAFELAFAAAPLLTLENEIEKFPRRADVLRARFDALAEALPERLRDDALELVRPETSSDNAGRLRVVWTETPELLVINGMVVPPDEVAGRELRVAGTLHKVFARSGNRFAYDRALAGGPEAVVARLVFQPLAAAPSREELARLEDDRDWLTLLSHTSRADLSPREARLAPAHLLALRRMDLGAWVDPDGWGMLTGRELRRARLVHRLSRPLAGWR